MLSSTSHLLKTVRTQVTTHIQHSLTHLPTDTLVALEPNILKQQITDFFAPAHALLKGGKHLRATFVVLGYASQTSLDFTHLPKHLLHLASAVELFQLQALIHDDIIDQAEQRRGMPSAHKYYTHHINTHCTQIPHSQEQRLGENFALLLGDTLLGIANLELSQALSINPQLSTQSCLHTHQVFNQMSTQVAIGQYLDMQAEQQNLADSFSISSSHVASSSSSIYHIILNKSAAYSVARPLQLGALLAGADLVYAQKLYQASLDAGISFQIQDDYLGLFGNSEQTGKPVGDDLREGKHTLLLQMIYTQADTPIKTEISTYIGNPHATSSQITHLLTKIRTNPALLEYKHLLTKHLTQSLTALKELPMSQTCRNQLCGLFEFLVNRQA